MNTKSIEEVKEFENIIKKVYETEKGLVLLRNILQNFKSYIDNFCTFFTDLNNALKTIYINTPYYTFIDQFISKQIVIKNKFIDLNKTMNQIYIKTSEWKKIFEPSKGQLIEYEKKKKSYYHYEQKYNKSSKKDKKIDKNESKYTKALTEYIDISEKIFGPIEKSLRLSWELTNPVVSELINGELKICETISSNLNFFKDNDITKLNDIQNEIKKFFNFELFNVTNKHRKLTRKISIKDILFEQNYNNTENVTPKINTFGSLSEEKLKEFFDIEDDLI